MVHRRTEHKDDKMSTLENLQSLAAFAATSVSRTAAPKNASLLSVEDARAVVKINIQAPKGTVDAGKQYVTLKLGQVKLSLDAVAPKLDRLAVEEEQIDHVVGILQAAIDDGTFDDAIVVGQKRIEEGYVAAQAKKNAPATEEVEPATEEDAVAEIGGLDLDALDDELEV
jgi:hypothetical protein